MLKAYQEHSQERHQQGISPLPLDAAQTAELVELLKGPEDENTPLLIQLLSERVPAGVDEAAYVKAAFLADVARGQQHCPVISPATAVKFLGTMLGGYNVEVLVELLAHPDMAPYAVTELSHTLLIFDRFHDILTLHQDGNNHATQVLTSWAKGQWFTDREPVAEVIKARIFKVDGEINTDDLSPAVEAWSRPDIPLHAKAMLQNSLDDQPNTLKTLAEWRAMPEPIAFVGDVVGTGSSRKSATNSLLWHIGKDIPYVPNKRSGGICLGGRIAPIFFNTLEDAGALPIECDVNQLNTGDLVSIFPAQGKICDAQQQVITTFSLKSPVILDEVRSGGRIPLIIGKGLSLRATEALGQPPCDAFYHPQTTQQADGYTLAQKMVGRACGSPGVLPNSYCEPKVSTVGSQDTTGPMTRDELKELACLGFSSDFVLQSFCHTAAYPKPVDIETQHTLPDFFRNRGGVSLKPGDGIIHSWLNRMLLPDQIGTGGDSHTRFPLGISFPAGSGMVAFAAALGVMPLDMPESILVKFRGTIQPGITLRDLVNAIPWRALQTGDLTLDKKNKHNIFSGRILEIQGLPQLKIEQAFELSDASAERSASGCTIALDKEPIIEYLRSNITLIEWMITQGYADTRTLKRRAEQMEAWLADPQLLVADENASYHKVIDISLDEIHEPLLACPNDPDDIKTLSEVAGTDVDEVFIGSCMTNIGHFRAAGRLFAEVQGNVQSQLWLCPPTRMDAHQLMEEGYYGIFGRVGARLEMPGCSLCMGNQARVAEGATVVSTSTRNFPNRMGKDAKVFLASAEVAAITAMLGRIPNIEEYQRYMQGLQPMAADIYRYLNFDQIEAFQQATQTATSDIPLTNVTIV